MSRAVLALLTACVAGALVGCDASGAAPEGSFTSPLMVGLGDETRGKALVAAVGCGGCHVIPGVARAGGTVGPPLTGFARRVYAGSRLNTPVNLVEFLVDPVAVDPNTPMPRVGLGEEDARDIAAFLYTLQ